MKIDKETLIKNHFWILTALFMPLALVMLLVMWTTVAGEVASKKNKLDEIKGTLKRNAHPQVKNPHWVNVLKEKQRELTEQKLKAWRTMYEGQKDVMTWPAELKDRFRDLDMKRFGEQLSVDFRDAYVNRDACYRKQVDELVKIVQPVDEKGEGVVQFRGGWDQVIRYVSRWYNPKAGTTAPTTEEVWLAQEDLWVQRELLRAVREANDFTAELKKAPEPPKQPGETDHQIFYNARWKLELVLTPKELRWKITNRSNRQQLLGIHFAIHFDNSVHNLFVDGEPLAPYSSTEGKEKAPVALARFKAVEQVLTWRDAPVKRIDTIHLAVNSNRCATMAFQGLSGTDDGTTTGAQPMQPVGPGFPQGQPVQPGTQPPLGGKVPMDEQETGVGGQPTSSAQAKDILRNRYITVNDQVRQMAVGMVLIVDQAHVQDVLTALANSPMRMQIAQVHWRLYRGSIQPSVAETKPEQPKGPPVGAQPPPPPPPVRGQNLPVEQPGSGDASAGGAPAYNLVELSVYGIVSLYQKPPDANEQNRSGSTVNRKR
ncbi:MAG: hypothetical protein KatS3mg105_3936 [Gemmatales bacterium]|nr:MAG: hypothetical protein KatS3mg105_3936 [Gemmatales bacterium]